jgi:hypothetical protein
MILQSGLHDIRARQRIHDVGRQDGILGHGHGLIQVAHARATPTSFLYETKNQNGSLLTVRGEQFFVFYVPPTKVGDQLCPDLGTNL